MLKVILIAGIRRGNGKQQGNDKADNGRAGGGEDMLSDQESEGAREEANDDRAEGT